MAVLGVLFGVVLGVCALVLPFVASAAAAGARTRTKDVLAQVKLRGKRVEALQGGVHRLQQALHAKAGR